MPPAEVITWSPGLLVASYTLIREIARGGMGEIWLALHRTAGVERLVVIKRIIAAHHGQLNTQNRARLAVVPVHRPHAAARLLDERSADREP